MGKNDPAKREVPHPLLFTATMPIVPRGQIWTVPLEANVLAEPNVRDAILGATANLLTHPGLGYFPARGEFFGIDNFALRHRV